jgi:hypothetical protein
MAESFSELSAHESKDRREIARLNSMVLGLASSQQLDVVDFSSIEAQIAALNATVNAMNNTLNTLIASFNAWVTEVTSLEAAVSTRVKLLGAWDIDFNTLCSPATMASVGSDTATATTGITIFSLSTDRSWEIHSGSAEPVNFSVGDESSWMWHTGNYPGSSADDDYDATWFFHPVWNGSGSPVFIGEAVALFGDAPSSLMTAISSATVNSTLQVEVVVRMWVGGKGTNWQISLVRYNTGTTGSLAADTAGSYPTVAVDTASSIPGNCARGEITRTLIYNWGAHTDSGANISPWLLFTPVAADVSDFPQILSINVRVYG